MNQIKSNFQDISYNPFNKSDSLFEDPNNPDSHYFDETDYDSKCFQVNEINTFLNVLTQHENLSLLHLSITSLRSNLDDFHTLLEESKHSFNVKCLTENWLNDHLKQYRITTYQITKEFIMKEKLIKKRVALVFISGMISPIKFQTICAFLMAIREFSQLNYLKKA